MPIHVSSEAGRIRTDRAYSGVVAALWRHGRDGERWLSQKTPSLRDIRGERGPEFENPSLGDRFRLLLYSCHSITATSVVSGATLIVMLVLAGSVGIAVNDGTLAIAKGLPELTLAIAGVLGGVIGILIAIIVFAVQFHGEPSRDASQLMRFLIRWEALVPIAGITLAFVTAQVIAAIIGTLWWEQLTYGMAIVDLLGTPLAIWTVVYLFHRMLYSITTDFFTQGVMPGLIVEYVARLDRDSRWAAMDRVLYGKIGLETDSSSELGQLGVEFSGWSLRPRGKIQPLGPLRSGVLVDVNLSVVARMVDLVRSEMPGSSLVLTKGLGQQVDGTSIFHLKCESSSQQDGNHHEAGCCELMLNRLCKKAVRVRKSGSDDLGEMLDAIIASAIERIRGGAWREADQVTRVILTLHERRIQRPDRDRLDVGEINLTGFLSGGENIYEIAHAAAESRKPEIVDVVCKFALRLAGSALAHDVIGLYQKSISLIPVIYYGLASSDEPQESSIQRVDTWLHSLPDIDFHAGEERRSQSVALRPYREIAIAEVIGMAKDAIRFSRLQDALDFHQRAVEIVTYDRYRHDGPKLDGELVRHLCYGQVLLIGWALELARREEIDLELVAELLTGVIKECHELHLRNPWLDAWEARSDRRHTSLFGEDRWIDSLRRFRSGVAYSSSVSREWIFQGMLLLLLKTPPTSHPRDTPLPQDMPRDDAAIKGAIDDILSIPGVHEALIKNSEGEKDDKLVKQLDDHKKTISRAFEFRRMLRKKADVEAAVLRPPDQKIRIAGLECAQSALDGHTPGWLTNPGPNCNAITTAPFLIRIDHTSLRRWFIHSESTISNLGESHAEDLANDELMYLFLSVEKHSLGVAMAQSADELKERIREACASLRENGYCPDTLFLPHQNRFANELTGLPGWRRMDRDQKLLGHCGVWEDLNIYEIPYHNTAVVVVADSGRLWGKHEAGRDHLSFTLVDEYAQRNSELLQAARNAKTEAEMPSVDDVKIIERWTLIPRFGCADMNAARHIPLDLTSLGYAMSKDDRLYHRPDCGRIADRNDLSFSLSHHLGGEGNRRQPCPDCQPDEWDWTGEDAH